MGEPAVVVERDGAVAVVSLNRPDDLNVFSGQMATELSAAYRDCDADPEVRVIVLTGRGSAFCAGADMASDSSFAAAGAEFSAQPLECPPWSLGTPVIAAVQGHAIGIGLTLALQCDIRFVAADAKLAIPQVRRGMLGDAGSHWTLRRFTSQAVAADLLLTGRTFRGSEGVELGLFSRSCSADATLSEALEAARDMARHASPASLALSKRLLWADIGLDETIRRESAYHRLLMGTPDAVEGPAAWRERRDPQWLLTATDVEAAAQQIDDESSP